MKKILTSLALLALLSPVLVLAAPCPLSFCPPENNQDFRGGTTAPNATDFGPSTSATTPNSASVQPIDTSGISAQATQNALAHTQEAMQQLTETGQQIGCSSEGQLGGALGNAVGASLQNLQGALVGRLGSLGQGVINQIASKAGPFGQFVSTAGNILLNKGLGFINNALGGLVDRAVGSIVGQSAQSAVNAAVSGLGAGAGLAGGAAGIVGSAAGIGAGAAVPTIVVDTVIRSDVAKTRAESEIIRANAITTREGTEILVKKECILDPTVKALMNSLLARATSATLDAFNSGCNGSACFVTQLKGFLHDIADVTLQNAEDRILSGICSPQRQAVQTAILTRYQFESNYGTQTQCSSDESLATRRAQGDYIGGGGNNGLYDSLWDQAGGYYAFGTALSVTGAMIAENQNNEITQLNWGNGCKSRVRCGTGTTGEAQALMGPGGICIDGYVVMPGTLVCDQEAQALDRANQELINAHEIGEVVDSLFSSLAQVAFSAIDGLFALSSQSSNGNGSYLDQLVGQGAATGSNLAQNVLASDIQGSIDVEEAYHDTLEVVVQDLNTAKSGYTQAIACYQPLTNGGNGTISSQMALDAVSHSNTTVTTVINPQITNLNNQIDDSESALELLASYRDSAAGAASIDEITLVTTQFNQLMNSGLVHNATDLQYLENNLSATGQTLEALIDESAGLLAVCRGQ